MSMAGHRVLRAMVLLLTTTVMTLLTALMTASMLGVIRNVPALGFKYNNHAQMGRVLKQMAVKNPTLTKLYSTGGSYQGRDLWVLAIGKHVRKEAPLIPNVKYIANMHGNEVVGRQLLLHLADYFLKQYYLNATIQTFLDTTNVHLMPTMNPDGYSLSTVRDCLSVTGRGNYYRNDLNRNFPDPSVTSMYALQRETTLIINWIQKQRFVLSANLHGGAEVVNYPWDSLNGDMTRVQYAATPDDDVFRHLSLIYSRTHPTMHLGSACGDTFEDGITNGANWYPISGGMADYMYREASGYELLIEMSCCKFPDPSTLPTFWDLNKDALINLLFAVHMGVKGIVSIENDTQPGLLIPVPDAVVLVGGRENVTFHTTAKGEYYKLLLPGDYVLKVLKPGYKMEEVPFTVYDGNVTILHVLLKFKQPFIPNYNKNLGSTVGHTTMTIPTAVPDSIYHTSSSSINIPKTRGNTSMPANSDFSVNPTTVSLGSSEHHVNLTKTLKTKSATFTSPASTLATTQSWKGVNGLDNVARFPILAPDAERNFSRLNTTVPNKTTSVTMKVPHRNEDAPGKPLIVNRLPHDHEGMLSDIMKATTSVNDRHFDKPGTTVTEESSKVGYSGKGTDVINLDKHSSTSQITTVRDVDTDDDSNKLRPGTDIADSIANIDEEDKTTSASELSTDDNADTTDLDEQAQGQVMDLENGAFHSSQNLATGFYTFILILTSLFLS